MSADTLSTVLADWVKGTGLPTYKAAPALGMCPAVLYRYINGSSVPPTCRLRVLASLLGQDHDRIVALANAARLRIQRRHARGRA